MRQSSIFFKVLQLEGACILWLVTKSQKSSMVFGRIQSKEKGEIMINRLPINFRDSEKPTKLDWRKVKS
jgi:hypothetical protein